MANDDHPFAGLFAAIAAAHEMGEPAPTIEPEVQAALLKAAAAAYVELCPFKAGDLVTPKPGGTARGAGMPHVVLEVLHDPPLNLEASDPADTASSAWGRRLNVRIAWIIDGSLAAFWQEHWTLEPWDPSMVPAEEASEAEHAG